MDVEGEGFGPESADERLRGGRSAKDMRNTSTVLKTSRRRSLIFGGR